MTTKLGRAWNRLFPWPSPPERRAAVREAEQERRRAERERARAERLAAELRELSRQNHLAEAIARQLRDGRV